MRISEEYRMALIHRMRSYGVKDLSDNEIAKLMWERDCIAVRYLRDVRGDKFEEVWE